jgi:hypothetical protein
MTEQQEMFESDLTIARRTFFDAAIHKGMDCPCCDRYSKVNKYRFNKSIVQILIWLDNKSSTPSGDNKWVYTPSAKNFVTKANAIGKLRWWGMAETKEPDRDTKCSGNWRITPHGRAFVNNQCRALKYLYGYNKEVIDPYEWGITKPDETMITFNEAMASLGFSYAEAIAPIQQYLTGEIYDEN